MGPSRIRRSHSLADLGIGKTPVINDEFDKIGDDLKKSPFGRINILKY